MRVTDVELEDKDIVEIFTTALEGGIGYWAVCDEYKWQYLYEDWSNDIVKPIDDDHVLAVLSDTEGEDFKDVEIGRAHV